jgi:5-methylcytosine-specific restriction protein A
MRPQTEKSYSKSQVITTADYMKALKSLMPLPPSYLRMLGFHYRQPARTATAAAVAEAVGFKTYRGANLHYGRLAQLVGKRLRWRRREEDEVGVAVLLKFSKPGGHWNWIMKEELAKALKNLGWVGAPLELMPGEMPEKTKLIEGAVYRVAVTAYERNPEARTMCLEHYGRFCVVCGFDFNAKYGPKAEGFIEVHHIRMLSEIGKEYEVDPVKDLRPVCPNCHSVIHLKAPPYTIEQLRAMVRAHEGS